MQAKSNVVQQIIPRPHPALALTVVIPSFNEPDILPTLESLWRCDRPACNVEVLIIINASEGSSLDILRQNDATREAIHVWQAAHDDPKLKCYVLNRSNLPAKHHGVGLARKIGMDLAANRLFEVGKARGIIACLDADSLCAPNYLRSLETHFISHPKSPACSIYFEHPLAGPYEDRMYQGIAKYELFLRYYIEGLRLSGFPHAYHTIGSSMAVRADAYRKQGGMNQRQAGEDFHFLHKLIPLGGFTELTQTTVIPSPRSSLRVPFGTGKSMTEWIQSTSNTFPAYHPKIFDDLKELVTMVPHFFRAEQEKLKGLLKALPESVRTFLTQSNFKHRLNEMNGNAASMTAFQKRFFRWFDGLKALKFVHFARDRYYGKTPVEEAAVVLLKKNGLSIPPDPNNHRTQNLLKQLRERQRTPWQP